MNLTQEQLDIINSSGDIKINAVAGSGKTTTIIEYAKARPKNSRILYLAYNKSVRLEAAKKFQEKGLTNVSVETAHSLAYKNVVSKNGYQLRAHGYKIYEIVDLLGLEGNGEKHAEYIVANHIHKFISYYCNSDKTNVSDLNYLDVVTDKKAKTFVRTFYNYIETKTKLLLTKMDQGDIEITHDFYLKKFQLSNPVLNYDYILFDEAQDASGAILDVFLKQKATKVIVGDTHQQIYGWRFAINSLEKTHFKTYYLSNSFRFSQDVANLALEILKTKKILDQDIPFKIFGKGNLCEVKNKAIIARTNLGLLQKAIEYITDKKNIKSLYFEGNINSYTYAEEGASLYDVLNLYNNQKRSIKDKLIQKMANIQELKEYIDKTEDMQMRMMLEIVNEYGNQIPVLINELKQKHIENDDKYSADMIFSTVHRSKGMEYDAIQLADDFLSKDKLVKLLNDVKKENLDLNKLNEEINLLYVAVTRTKNFIFIPEELLPENCQPSKQIRILRTQAVENETPNNDCIDKNDIQTESETKPKAYSIEKIRETHKDAYSPWTPELDHELTLMYCEGISTKDMARHFGRTPGAIRARIKKLELEEAYGWQQVKYITDHIKSILNNKGLFVSSVKINLFLQVLQRLDEVF